MIDRSFKVMMANDVPCINPYTSVEDGRIDVVEYVTEYLSPPQLDTSNPNHRPADADIKLVIRKDPRVADAVLHILIRGFQDGLKDGIDPPQKSVMTKLQWTSDSGLLEQLKKRFEVTLDYIRPSAQA